MASIATPLAHIAADGREHGLLEHLDGVATRASGAGGHFDSAGFAHVAGLWHDAGKFAADFQAMIRSANGLDAHLEDLKAGRVDHSSAGAVHALAAAPGLLGQALALVIAGHHAGLADFQGSDNGHAPLASRLAAAADRLVAARNGGWNPAAVALAPPQWLGKLPDREACFRQYEFWVRMLYSALVDADFLDTEAFMDPDKAQVRGGFAPLAPLRDKLDARLNRLSHDPQTALGQLRREVLDEARAAALLAPGLFSLTVPTGGGKTLSSLSFALNHALKHGLERVIFAIPYTSIVEQTAQVFRDVLGADAVLEHHSQIGPDGDGSPRHRLAAENWDAPVIVTTNVQLFESLFHNRSSRCRKLHRIARSVVVLDEAQTLPPHLLAPVLDAIRTLSRDYGTTFLLMSATPPALEKRESLTCGLEGVREIAADPQGLAQRLRRVRFHLPADLTLPTPFEALAERLAGHPSVLAIVHRRQDAAELTAALDAQLGEKTTHHLSARMCGQHRSEVLATIKAALRAGRPVRVVATQLVEAGVDIDFPVVYRALAGLDSLVQAAGRCNREGNLPSLGEVHLFVAPALPPPGILQRGLECLRTMLAANPDLDLLLPGTTLNYSRRLFGGVATDARKIQSLREQRQFRTVAERFQMIDQGQEAVIVPYPGSERAIAELRALGPSRERMRAVQRFTVQVNPRTMQALENCDSIERIGDAAQLPLLSDSRLYDLRLGLLESNLPVARSPESLVIDDL